MYPRTGIVRLVSRVPMMKPSWIKDDTEHKHLASNEQVEAYLVL